MSCNPEVQDNRTILGEYEVYGDYTPYSHQVEIIKFMLKYKRAYVWADMGTGKSASSLWFSDILLSKGKISKVLIIAPLSTLDVVWVNDIKTVCPYRKYSVVHGSRPERIKALQKEASFYITNTDCVRSYLDDLIRLKPDVVIIDEITDFSNAQTKRSKCMQKLAQRTAAVYGLSGDPVAGGLLKSFGIAKVVRPEGLPTRYFTRYREMILNQVSLYEYIPKPEGPTIVNKALTPAINFRLEDCVDLPPIVFETRKVTPHKETARLFKEILDHQIAEYKQGIITAQTAGVKAIRLAQILTGSTKTEEGEILHTNIDPMLSELLEIFHQAGGKLVVFCQAVETVKRVNQFFLNKGIHSRYIYGQVNGSNRKQIIEEFQTFDEGVLVAQVRTMSHGVTLTKSNTLVFFGIVAGNEIYRQAIRRIRRIGQKHRQTIIRLLSSKFEQTCFDKLDKSQLTADEFLKMYDKGPSDFI